MSHIPSIGKMATHSTSKYLQIPFDPSELDKPSPLALLATAVSKIGSSPRRPRRHLVRTTSRLRRESTDSSCSRSPIANQLTPPTSQWLLKDADASPTSASPHSTEVSPTVSSPLYRLAPLYKPSAHYSMYHRLPAVRYSPYSPEVPTTKQVVPVMNPTCYRGYPDPQYSSYHDRHLLHQGIFPQLPIEHPTTGVYPPFLPSTSYLSSLKSLTRRLHRLHVPTPRSSEQEERVVEIVV